MRFLKVFALLAASGLMTFGCTQVKPVRGPASVAATPGVAIDSADPVTARMDAKWVSAIRGMNVETSAGAILGRVVEVVVDGYGHGSFAVVAYGGVMRFGTSYTAVPWATVAGMLEKDRLVVDRSNLENAPLLRGKRPDSGDPDWRHQAARYWNEKVALAQ
jgi:sporulation protein YlmC with PRC-barrel domain